MKSSSLKMIDAGISNPREYRDELTNEWYPRPDYREHLEIFVLCETEPALLFFALKDGDIIVKGKSYSVTWINPPSKCREAKFLLVSLRYCRYLERGFALVKVLQGSNKYMELEY